MDSVLFLKGVPQIAIPFIKDLVAIRMLTLFLHGDLYGDSPYGWQGFAFAALLALALCLGFNQLAKAALTKLNKKPKKKLGRQPRPRETR
jgi:cytochrome b